MTVKGRAPAKDVPPVLHLLKPNSDNLPICYQLAGFYKVPAVTTDLSKISCKKCLRYSRKLQAQLNIIEGMNK